MLSHAHELILKAPLEVFLRPQIDAVHSKMSWFIHQHPCHVTATNNLRPM